MLFRFFGWFALIAAAPLVAGDNPVQGITKISPVVYDNILMKSFLADYLGLTEAQMVQSDLAFAEARARIFPLNEKLKTTQASLDQALTDGLPPLRWKPMVTAIANMQAQMLTLECAALGRFRNLLDGDQRHKLNKLSRLSITTNENGAPVVAESVER